MLSENELVNPQAGFERKEQAVPEKRLQGGTKNNTRMSAIPRRSQSNHVALAFAQQRIWFLDQLNPESSLYNFGSALRIRGGLNLDGLRHALSSVVARHEALRTCYVSVEGNPVQLISDPVPMDLPIVDLSTSLASLREAEAQGLILAESKKPFHLAKDLMIRALLIRMEATEHILVITMQHIATDAWSMGVFFHEVSEYYDAYITGRTPSLPELKIQYADYALWQKEWLKGEVLAKQLNYWKQKLSGAKSLLELPTDRPRPVVQSFRGATQTYSIPVEIVDGLKQLSRKNGVTLFMTLIAAFKVLLYRYSRQEDILVGSPIAGRNRVETERSIGFFVNTLVLRTDLSGDPTFKDLVGRVKDVAFGAFAHQDLPFDKLVEEIHPERNSSYAPLVQVMFVFQNAPAHALNLPNATTTPVDIRSEDSKFDLTLFIEERGQGLSASFEYAISLFEDATIARMWGHFETLMREIIQHPEQRISKLRLLTSPERQQLLVDWNNTQTDYPCEKCVHVVFEEQVERTPDDLAVKFNEQCLTYAELNRRANQVARYLRKIDVKPGSIVGIFMERSPELIVGLLGILKAGCAYAALDPASPKERLTLMLEDLNASAILMRSKSGPLMPVVAEYKNGASRAAHVIHLVDDWDRISSEGRGNLDSEITPEDLAYICFTSGSTGRPKGVCVPHRGVVRLVQNTNYASFSSNDIFLQLAPVSFDASTFEIWGALLNGARLVIFPPFIPSLSELGDFITSNKITILWITTGLFHQMVEERLESLRSMRQILTGGEVLSVSHARKALNVLTSCPLINCYGPTENTTFTTCYTIPISFIPNKPVPIGRPISNTECYVLDENMQPVPIGVPGQLYVGGAGLACGYLNRPELTEERFVSNPFASEKSEKLYKTGDLVRYLADGNIEFLGRIDQQVKIRGFRIEPGEIEAVLAAHLQLVGCAVIVREDSPGNKELVAYYVPHKPEPTVTDLRKYLRERLPEYMMPASFVKMEALPLTQNGKLDRSVLPVPDRNRSDLEVKYIAPRDAIETELAAIWENVLGVSPIGMDDRFFDLGGHSLLAVRLLAQIEKKFGKKLPLAAVFQAPTVSQLAPFIRDENTPLPGSAIVEIQPKGNKPPLFFVHGVGGGMFWGYTNISRHLGSEQPVFALKSRSMDGREEFETIEEMAAQYVADIRAFQPNGPYHLGGYCFGGNVAFEMARQLNAQGEEVAMLVALNCVPPNSKYSCTRLTPGVFVGFLKNLGYLFIRSLKWGAQQRNEFLRWKGVLIKRKIASFFNLSGESTKCINIEDMVDLSAFPQDQKKIWETHIRALLNFFPKPYEGKITLFRSPGHQLFCSYDYHYGWSEFAREVEVHVVPGGHESILEEPHVRVVAEKIKECLLKLQMPELVPATVAPVIQTGKLLAGVETVVKGSTTNTDYPRELCIHQLFEEQVKRTPDNVSVIFQDRQLSYAELNRKANQVALHLQSLGVGADMPVAICLERSIELVVGILGILKAGGAYVPLDPAYPQERLKLMLESSQASILLTQEKLMPTLPRFAGKVISLDQPLPTSSMEQLPVVRSTPQSLAYVIYTSGSTGKPKGVAMEHRPLLNLIWWQLKTSVMGKGDRTLQFSSPSFDVSFQEIFSTWCSGGTLMLVDEDTRHDPARLLNFVETQKVNRMFLPFIALNQFAESMCDGDALPNSLREVITAGEQLRITGKIINLFSRLKNCTLHNHYGPSESHVVTAYTLEGRPETWPALPSIGKPISNAQIHLLDEKLNPVKAGEIGELYIGGDCLARGYLHRPDLTREKFIPDPFSLDRKGRLYKTGDLGRLLPDGNIEFLGRADHQVKIRGYRIELSEIETTLSQFTAVRECAVTAREDVPGQRRLVGYVVSEPDKALTVGELRRFLGEKLPGYMVPSAFVFLEALPLTPSGKVNRLALPAPDQSRPELDGEYVAARDNTEEQIAAIWCEVLNLKQVGVHDNFFELGGNSLLVAQVISRLRGVFKLELPLSSLFDAPTIAQLSGGIASKRWSQNQRAIPSISDFAGRKERRSSLDSSSTSSPEWKRQLSDIRNLENVRGARFPFLLSSEPAAKVRALAEENQAQLSLKHVAWQLPGLDLGAVNQKHHSPALCDITLSLAGTGAEMAGFLEYHADLFDAATVAGMAGYLPVLLENMVSKSSQRVARLPLPVGPEREQLLVEWNKTEVDFPSNQTYSQLFEAQAKRTPTVKAVRFQGQELSYDELNRRANQLAYHLNSMGVGAGVIVAVSLGRSLELPVALLGILKSGGAYLPLDPAYPLDRLASMLEDSKAKVLITVQANRNSLPSGDTKVICLDTDWKQISQLPEHQPECPATADDTAYVIYTSGSTGKPKGVPISHRSMLNHNYAMARLFGLQPKDRVLQFASISFDISVEELFPSWLNGCTVVLRTEEVLGSMPAFMRFVKEEKITVLNLPTAFWHEMVNHLAETGLPEKVRLMVIGGEAAKEGAVAIWQKHVRPEVVLMNSYGPTEATVTATVFVPKPEHSGRGYLPIGRPIANTKIYILDSELNPVSVGVPGEIYIGGVGLTQGYLNRPELTVEKFIKNPFVDDTNARLYRTGDLGRYLPDGNIEFLGRVDHQVKIRGFRIELSEIEGALERHPAVQESVVVAREDVSGQRRLVAYLVKQSGEEVSISELRRFLQEKLPDYMVPAAYVFLESLPMTPGGKLDRQALPAPDQSRPELEQQYLAPRNETEQQLVAIWSDVLDLKPVGVLDNFFELGGHSLLAAQLISRIREAFKLELPVASIFEAPTVSGLSEGLRSGRWNETEKGSVPARVADQEESLPLSFSQRRLWFIDRLEPGSHAYNVPTAIELEGVLIVDALQRSLEKIVERHEALRTTISFVDGNLTQVIAPKQKVDLPLIDLHKVPASDRQARARKVIDEEAQRPFDLARGPLLRCKLVKLGEKHHILIVVMHHIISDGWSLGLFFEELGLFYNAQSSGKPATNLPELPVQYADYALWQHHWMQGEVLEEEAAYWKAKLNNAPTSLEMPLDHTLEVDAPPIAGMHRTVLPQSLMKSVSGLSRREGITPFMVLMATLSATLHKWTHQSDMVIGTVVAGRNLRETENLIGCFMNFVPIRSKIEADETGTEFLRKVKETVLEAHAHQDCPFEKMVEVINPERRTAQNPLYNVALLVQNFPTANLNSSSLKARLLPVDLKEALLDLRFIGEETPDGFSLACEYKTALFESATIEQLMKFFCVVLEQLIKEPQRKLADVEVSHELNIQIKSSQARQNRQTLAVTSTFTAEPIEEGLRYWMKELDVTAKLEFAGFNQVFQELLDPGSLLSSNQNGANIVLVRLEDWEKFEGDARTSDATPTERLRRSVDEFVTAIRAASSRNSIPYIVVLCPASRSVTEDSGRVALHEEMAAKIQSEIQSLAGVHLIKDQEIHQLYPVTEYNDPEAEELGHIPYTPLFFTALGTSIARKFHALKRSPYKVVVLDCDNTLWSGVCGEDGAMGVGIDGPYQALQQFVRKQGEMGMLICLCSKNEEEDVAAVFEQRGEMPLKQQHLTASRINWLPKSENLRSLADELKLGLDSFIFIDDNPVECAEVESKCPEVMTLLLPEDPVKIPQFLQHCWVFDHLKLSAEDKQRTVMYRQEKEREQFRERATGLGDFLAGLELKVDIAELTAEQVTRAAQLTLRTNQFNMTTRRRTEGDLQSLMRQAKAGALTVCVRDRFGDYGLVGLIIHAVKGSSIDVDTFLLSCRVLGRGVEYQMVVRLGRMALAKGLDWVDFHFNPTEKNKPAFNFIDGLAAQFRQASNGGYLYRIPAEFAAGVVFNPEVAEKQTGPRTAEANESRSAKKTSTEKRIKFRNCRSIALEANAVEVIQQAMEMKSRSKSRGRKSYAPPTSETEQMLCKIWEELLRVEKVGIHDNFFELGGHSLLAVRLFAQVEKLTGKKLPLVTLFQSSTVKQLADILCQNAGVFRSSVVPIQAQGSKPPLFLVHGAGGDVLWGYANLAPYLGADQPVYGIKSRALNGAEEFNSLEEMASFYIEQMRLIQKDGPYYLGGYCFGGNVAYEMARQLDAEGEEVALVALLDAAPSNGSYERIPWWSPAYGFRFARNLSYWLEDFFKAKPEDRREFILRKSRALARKFSKKIFRSRSSQPQVDLEEVIDLTKFPQHELRLWQLHLDALVRHVSQPYEGKVTLFRTRGQPLFCSLDDDFCWGELVRGGVEIRSIPGSHESIFMEPDVKELAKELKTCLAQTGTTTKSEKKENLELTTV